MNLISLGAALRHSVAAACMLAIVALGLSSCGSKTSHTAGKSTGADKTTSSGGSTSSTGTTTAPAKTATTGTVPARVARPRPAHPMNAPVNLVADVTTKAQLLAAVQHLAATDKYFRKSHITGPRKGSTYYAGQGDYEYAQAGFVAPGTSSSGAGDTIGTAWRKIGGPWVAVDLGTYGDITPLCMIPDQIEHIWTPGVLANPCSAAWSRSKREFADLSGTVRCVAEDANDGSGSSFVACGHFSHDGRVALRNATLNAAGPGLRSTDALTIESSPLERLAYGVSTPIKMHTATFKCTLLPDRASCTNPAGHTITVTADAERVT